jgi:radical SAM protein with 4Fe4S-binding SPASM domain
VWSGRGEPRFEMSGPYEVHCGPIDRNHAVIQHFECPVEHISGISLRFGTFRQIMCHRLCFRLDLLDDASLGDVPLAIPGNRTPIFQTDVAASGITDGEDFHLYFPTVANTRGTRFALTIFSSDAAADHAVTVWLSRGEGRIPGHISCRSRVPCSPDFGLRASLIVSEPTAAAAYPEGLLYSPLSSCNLNCVHCVSRHTRSRVARLPERIRQDITNHAVSGQLRWMFTDYSGDIFFAERKNPGELAFVLGLGIAVHIDTNGACLDRETIDRVMESKVDALNISIDAAQDATFRAIRIGAPPIDQIFATANMVIEARARHGRTSNFRVALGFTLMRSNLHELPLFIQIAAKIGVDAVSCRHLEVYHADMEPESLFYHRAYFNSIRAACLELARSLSIPLLIGEELTAEPNSSGVEPCMIPWSSAVLIANGDVMACCVPGSRMGNLDQQSLEEIWQGHAYRRLRARVNSADPPSLCRNCQFRRSLNSYDSVASFRAQHASRPLLEELMAESSAAV